MTVTVCIPAYQAEDFIIETVSSVLGQTHADLKLVIAIDPPADGSPDKTIGVLSRFIEDERVTVHQNAHRLGWAENCNSLVRSVDTEYFIFLPHDDVWAPDYLEVMLKALRAAPEAVVAYSDTVRFSACPPVRVSMTMTPKASRARHLLDFLVQGTEAQIWRGLTRTSTLTVTGGFPTDKHKGFVVECEYALALYLAGPVVHVPRVLYFKRIYEREVVSASRERVQAPISERRQAWQVHKQRMQAMLETAVEEFPLSEQQAQGCRAALLAAMLRRYQQFVESVLQPEQLEGIEQALVKVDVIDTPLCNMIQANIHLILQKHYLALEQNEKARQHATTAWQLEPNSAEAQLERARYLFHDGQYHESIGWAMESARLSHLRDSRAAENLVTHAYQRLGWNQTAVDNREKNTITRWFWLILLRCRRFLQ